MNYDRDNKIWRVLGPLFAYLGIRFLVDFSYPKELQIDVYDIGVVLNNALENAINACESLEPAKRFIEIIVLTNPCFMFQIRNSYNGIIAFDENEIPISPKKGHGFGTQSIVTFCEKNRADYEFKANEEYFALRVSFH